MKNANERKDKHNKIEKPEESKILAVFNGWMSTIRVIITVLIALITIGTIIVGYFGLSGIRDYQFVMRYAADVREQKRSLDSLISYIDSTKAKLDAFEKYYEILEREITEIPAMQELIEHCVEDIDIFDASYTDFLDTLGKFNKLHNEFVKTHTADKVVLRTIEAAVDTLIQEYARLEEINRSLKKEIKILSKVFLNTGQANVENLNSRERLLLYLLADNLEPGDPIIAMTIGVRWLEISNYTKALERFEFVEKYKDRVPKDSWVLRHLPGCMEKAHQGLRGELQYLPQGLKFGMSKGGFDVMDPTVNLVELLFEKGYVEAAEIDHIFRLRK